MTEKRCLTIQDYSCMGRCSLTVALPVISTAGIETIGLPTAILSNHTAFKSWTYTDLTDKMEESVNMWDNYNHHVDCIYTGYLGNGQAAVVANIIRKLKSKDTFVVIDPAFGDNGKVYPGFDQAHVDEMRDLLQYADIITPNVTEAVFMLGEEYPGEKLDSITIQRIAISLSKFGPRKIVLTGIQTTDNHAGCAVFDRDTSDLSFYYTPNYPGKYHGAGDTFTSAMIGAYMNGISLPNSVKIAHDFVHRSIKSNLDDGVDGLQYGLEFEKNLSYYSRSITKMKYKEAE